jgi:protein gp37
MGDLFHGNVPFEWVDRVMVVIEDCPQHTFQILKKRPERMREYFSTHPVPRNAWLGVTVENQHTADERIPYLLSIDAEVRFLSCEPLLEAITVPSIEQIGWLIAGGEAGTGKRIRPMHPDWARDLRDQCRAAGVPFFFKQWGRFLPASQATEKQAEGRETCLIAGEAYYDMGGKQAGNVLDGQTHEEFPEFTCACCGAKDNATGYKNPARKFVACDGHKVDAATMDGDKVYQAVIRYDGYKMVYKMVCQACAPSAKRGKRKVKQQADLL